MLLPRISWTVGSRWPCSQRVFSRHLSVKELSWCAPAGSPNRLGHRVASKSSAQQTTQDEAREQELETNFRFGLVAAVSKKDRVIGINGKLPWNLPTDRKVFMDLTRDKTLIIGRHTFLERPNQTHLAHLHTAIVVSQTLADNPPKIDAPSCDIVWVDSLPKALWEAYKLSKQKSTLECSTQSSTSKELTLEEELNTIDCWIGGGERLYRDALLHPSAQFLHLTQVDIALQASHDDAVAYFPAKYRWDHVFKPAKDAENIQDDQHPYTIHLYKNRLTQQRCFTC